MISFIAVGRAVHDVSCVVQEKVHSGAHCAGNKAILKLVDHCQIRLFSAFVGVGNVVVGDDSIGPITVRGSAPLWVAVPADPSRVAVHFIRVPPHSLVIRARLLSYSVPYHPVIGCEVIPAVTPVVHQVAARVAGQDGLSSDDYFWPSSIALDFNAVGNHGSGSLGPARPAVPQDMLVLDRGQVVYSVHISPEVTAGKLFNRLQRLRMTGGTRTMISSSER